MAYTVDIKENAIDSFNEALAKYKQGEDGDTRSYKFAILHMAHFLELTLKMYVQGLDENLIFSKCFRQLEAASKTNGKSNLLEAFNDLFGDKCIPFDKDKFNYLQTIKVDDAVSLVRHEVCSKTGKAFVDEAFLNDIQWLKDLRNDIEHFKFEIVPKEVRLCLGRIVRQAEAFADIFSLFTLANEVGKSESDLYHELIDEYAHEVREAKQEVRELEIEAYRGVRHKNYQFVDWNVYECPECNHKTLVTNPESSTGFLCTLCGNRYSDEIEVECDCCGALSPKFEMDEWHIEEGIVELRCFYCSGHHQAEKND